MITQRIPSKLPNVGTTIFTIMSRLANEHGAINLSQGFPNFDCDEKLKALVAHHMTVGHNQYAPMAGLPQLRESIADKCQRLYGKSVNWNTEITVTAGATQAIFTAIAAFVRPGDEVILIDPAYDSYGPSIETFGGQAVVYELTAPDYQIDWHAFKKLISPRCRMIIINTPHNPTGQILSADDLLALQRITAGTDILLLSDEVYEHLVFDGRQHESVLRYPELFERSLLTFSFGKTFHNTGWKMGYCIAAPPLMKEFRKVHQFNVFSVNTPIQHAIADYLADPQVYLHLPDFYQQKRDFFKLLLAGSRFRPLGCHGTYFMLADYSAISNEPDIDFAKRLTCEQGVATIPVSVFYRSRRNEGVLRFCFAKTRDLLEQAGELLAKV